MKKTILLLLISLFSLITFAGPVDENTALKVASNFYSTQLKNSSVNLSLAYTCKSQEIDINKASKVNEQAYYYVFNNGNNGFVIISGDDATYPVLGYSDSGSYEEKKQASNFVKWMENYKQQIRYVVQNDIQATAEIKQDWSNILNKVSSFKNSQAVSALVTTKWSQSPYVNDLCPPDQAAGEYNGYHAVAGCPATAMAQIMKFWNYPTNGQGFHSYNHDEYGTLSANFASTTYDWASMPNVVSASNNAVATLMYHCGVAVEMNYGPQSSGSYVILDYTQSPEQCSEYAYKTYFDYDATTLKGLMRENYTDTEWKNLLKADLDAGMPIQYAGFGQGGHTFVCDGYDNNDYFHMNWGWGGYADGYFLLDALNPGSGGTGSGAGTYNNGQQAILGIKPANSDNSGGGTGGGETTDFVLNLYSDITPSVSAISYGQSFSVAVDIANLGASNFTGDLTAALFDKDYNFIDFVETITNQTLDFGYYYSLTFSSEGSLSFLPGQYYIGCFYKEVDADWKIIDEGSYTQLVSFNVENLDDIRLYSEMTSSEITQNETYTVNIDIANYRDTDFNGSFTVDLYNMNGTWAAEIEQINGISSPTYTYNNYTFTTSGVSVEPGTYLLALQYYENEKYSLAGTGDYTNPIKVTVKAPALVADPYENNDTEGNAYHFPTSFTNSQASILTTGSNMHSGEDYDYYKIELASGFDYTITARAHDSYNSADGNSYTNDVSWIYLKDGVWSDVYDDIMPNTIEVNDGGDIKFAVASYFIGDKGTYLLDLQIERTEISTSIEEIDFAENIKVYPIPAKDILTIDLQNFLGEVNKLELVSLTGKSILIDLTANDRLIKVPVHNLSNGVYILSLSSDKELIQKKVIINK